MSNKPISDLRRRMTADMTIRRFSEKTRRDYIRQIEAFASFLGRSPDTATGDARAASVLRSPPAARFGQQRDTRVARTDDYNKAVREPAAAVCRPPGTPLKLLLALPNQRSPGAAVGPVRASADVRRTARIHVAQRRMWL
jgi:hypothetical protein